MACSGEERVKPPICDGAIVIGPRRNRAYSSAMAALPSRLLARVFSVGSPSTSKIMRSCR